MRRGIAVIGVLIGIAATGCGGGGDGTEQVTVYASDSLHGAGRQNDIVRAEQLALREAGGRAGAYEVELVVLDEATTQEGVPPEAAGNARKAVADPAAVAFLGNSTSELTAAALPVTNRAGLLQVSPVSTYTGLTHSAGAARNEPGRYRPSGERTFGRVIPHDGIQAEAMVEFLRRDRIRSVAVLGEPTLFGEGLMRLLRKRIPAAGIALYDGPELLEVSRDPVALGRLLRERGVDGFLYAGSAPPTVVRAFAEGAPGMPIYFPDAGFRLGDAPEQLGAGEAAVRITGPPADTPPARAFAERFAAAYGSEPGPQALGGYESMRAVLDAIRRSGPDGADREAVRRAFFERRVDDSVFGPYSIDANGDATVGRYGLYRFRDRELETVATIKLD